MAALVAGLVALPLVLRALPADDRDVSAADLRAAVLASAGVGFSGYAVSAGGLALPVSEELPQVADLFSDRTSMRVWWRAADDHRVDVVTAAGETDLHQDPTGSWTWDYESNTATRAEPTLIALPRPVDLLPSTLGRRVLSEAADGELGRIGARRIAGTDALGVRLVPAEDAASVARVDVWVEPDTGLPVQVEVVADGAGQASLDTRFLDLELTRPSASVVAFDPPPGAEVRPAPDVEGLVAVAQRGLPRPDLPETLAGLPPRPASGVPSGIHLYGRGVTVLAVVPLPVGQTAAIRRALAGEPEAVVDELGTRVAAGPLGLMVLRPVGDESRLLIGTVGPDALETAAGELTGGPS
ncbi:transcriptional regulator [Blastococcus sp. TF02A-26]|nr:transcriptional regulator [Blastococcus sp. TF02A-26]